LGVVQGRSIICRKSENIINDDYTRALVKLAQTDVITTIVDGIHPDIRRTIFDSVTSYANTFFQRTLPSLTKKEFNLDKFKDSFAQEVINKIDEDFNDLTHDIWYKFYSSISVLPIQDLAALAESFISLQSMKRKYEMDSSLNSTVGGPIDVAIITKTEGVKWIKNSK
jgi:O-methyltransferase involved in polyketide biosynthesis